MFEQVKVLLGGDVNDEALYFECQMPDTGCQC